MADDDKLGEVVSGSKPGDDKIVAQARKRFARAKSAYGDWRTRFRSDIRFANADPDNHDQWPDAVFDARDDVDQVCLTINKVRQHNLLIKNDIRQNTPAVKISPTGGDATFDAAKIFEQVIKRIEYRSHAKVAVTRVSDSQVDGGVGYFTVDTDYVDDESFDQEPKIGYISNPLAVYIDVESKELDGHDMNWAFEFEDRDREEWDLENPGLKDKVGHYPAVGPDASDWLSKDSIRLCLYYRRRLERDKLYAYVDPDDAGKGVQFTKWSDVDEELRPAFKQFWNGVKDQETSNIRDLRNYCVEWFKIAGDLIYERGTWFGSTIPLIPAYGERISIDGQIDIKGHTRYLKDAQRMFNYNASASIEFGALQTKAPWVAALEAIEGNESWKTANVENAAVLTWNAFDGQDRPLPKPERIPPPTGSQLYMEGMQAADMQMMMASGQWQPQRGQEQVEASGVALNRRLKMGDQSTYHFIDNMAISVRRIGEILLEVIPKVYDTKRVIKIMADDGSEQQVTIDPQAQQAFVSQKEHRDAEAASIFNPCVGRYAVQADVGPSYATQREEAWNALIEVLKTRPEYLNLIGDILFRNADFKDADEIAERLKRIVPSYVLGEGPSPEMQQMAEQLKNLQGLVVQLSEKLVVEKNKTRGADEKNTIEVYKAETDRLKALLDSLGITPEMVASMSAQLEQDTAATDLTSIVASTSKPEFNGM